MWRDCLWARINNYIQVASTLCGIPETAKCTPDNLINVSVSVTATLLRCRRSSCCRRCPCRPIKLHLACQSLWWWIIAQDHPSSKKLLRYFLRAGGHHASSQSNWHHLICIMFPLIIAFSCISIKGLHHLGQDDIRGAFSLLNHGFISRTSLSCHLKWLISGKLSQSGSIRCAVKTKKQVHQTMFCCCLVIHCFSSQDNV